MKHFIFHRLSDVWAIREEDVAPDPKDDLWEKIGDSPEYKAIIDRYNAALETALSSKAVRVTNAHYDSDMQSPLIWMEDKGNTIGDRILIERPIESQLYDLPEGFEVKIEKHKNYAYDGTVMEPEYLEVASIVPIPEKTETPDVVRIINELFPSPPPQSYNSNNSQPLPEESQEDQNQIWIEAVDLVEGFETMQGIELLKSKFTITRK